MEMPGNIWNFSKIKKVLGHFGLLAAVTIYTAVGAIVFKHLEFPAEQAKLERLVADFKHQKRLFMLWTPCQDEPYQCVLHLDLYTEAVIRACKGGVSIEKSDNVTLPAKWTFSQAAFFATTVLTTIGYGNVVPETFGGRLFCIMFAIVGIPMAITVIADMGILLATAVSLLHERTSRLLPKRSLLVPPSLAKWISVLAGIAFLIVYLAAGATLFMFLEEGWGFFEGFYFCFITMTTIGFGDLVPGGSQYIAFCTIYILVGLSLTSTIIELVRRQYAQSWKTIQALSGPIAESLKKLSECSTSIDVSLIHGDIRKLLTMVSMPVKTGSRDEWQKAVDNVLKDIQERKPQEKPPIIQIIVYESSV